MVAYNFMPSFVPEIVSGTKRQTIRRPRARHARPGESLQLFVGMRTRACKKIVPDPICQGVDEVVISPKERLVEVNGILIRERDELDAYALGDGFRHQDGHHMEFMCRWWLLTHGDVRFEGVAIRWQLAGGVGG